MSKKYLIIKGSGRENGCTNTVCRELEAFLENEDVVVFDTFREIFAPCNGCNFCEENGRCAHRDLDEFYKQFEECDRVIFLTPVYNGTFPAPLKSLVDRFQVYYTIFYHNGKVQPIKKKREAYLVVSSGRDGESAFNYMKGQLECAFTILNIRLEGTFLCHYTDRGEDFSSVIDDIKRSLK